MTSSGFSVLAAPPRLGSFGLCTKTGLCLGQTPRGSACPEPLHPDGPGGQPGQEALPCPARILTFVHAEGTGVTGSGGVMPEPLCPSNWPGCTAVP